jgi:hypothetical protein
MQSSYMKILLSCIKNKKNLTALVDAGLTYGQIATMISEIQILGLIIESPEGKLILSDAGQKKIKDLVRIEANKSEWIMPREKNRIDKIKINDLYIPKKYISSKP